MSENLNQTVDLIHPTASGIGVITTDQIWVLFDRAIDEDTIAAGNFFVAGPDFDTWIGPDLQLFHEALSGGSGSGDILESPGFDGFLQGEISFERISTSSLVVVSGLDTVGSGLLYRTKAIFTPTNRLQNNTEYAVYLSGDEDTADSLHTGISERTVFDTIPSGTNTGTGKAIFTGGYYGPVSDVYRITITTSGEVGDSKFTFERDTDPYSVFGPFKTKRSGVLLSDGILVQFSEGNYALGDEWSVVVKQRKVFFGNLQWFFKTGSGNILSIPTTTATTVVGDIPSSLPVVTSSTAVNASTFQVLSTSPIDGATNLIIPAGEYTVSAQFNGSIDPLSVASGVSLSIYSEDVSGLVESDAIGNLIVEPFVSGDTLSIVIASGQLHDNEIIKVTLNKNIANTNAVKLGTDYSWCFTTRYYPLYCTVRRLRLFIGLFVNTIPDDTLNFAIYMASIAADHLTWNKNNLEDEYYKFVRAEWTCCRAAEILLLNTGAASGSLKSKRLGDLQVEYDTQGANTQEILRRAQECQLKWEGALMAGGRQVQSPAMVVKGALDGNRPEIGRMWAHDRDMVNSQYPVGNLKVPFGRRYKTTSARAVLPERKGWWRRR